ncbi:outer membrane beta-barrel protein [Spirosoma flavus]
MQAQPNTLLVYGNVSYDTQKTAKSDASSYTFSPAVGYQWNEHWTAGINLNLSGSKAAGSTSDIAVGPFIRYAQPLAGIFAIYGQFNGNFLSGSTPADSYRGFQGTLFPAIGINLKNSFALNFSFGSLILTTQKFAGVSEAQTNFHIGFGSGAGFGISKNFGL